MPKDRPDFINVRLSDHAVEQLGADAAVGVMSGNMHYQFRGTAAVEILRYPEWQSLRHDTFDGQPLFQEVTATPATEA